MTHEEMVRMMQSQMGGQQQHSPDITVELIDRFIQRCIDERDETLYTLAQALQWKLQQSPMVSFPELEVYPVILQRLQERLGKGEK